MKVYWSNARYVVWSTHVIGLQPEDRVNVIELRRTDRKVAENDADLISSTFRRKAWVQDTQA